MTVGFWAVYEQPPCHMPQTPVAPENHRDTQESAASRCGNRRDCFILVPDFLCCAAQEAGHECLPAGHWIAAETRQHPPAPARQKKRAYRNRYALPAAAPEAPLVIAISL